VLDRLAARGKSDVILPRPNRLTPREFDRKLYKERPLIENCFRKLKQFRAIAKVIMLCDRLYEWQLKPTTGPAYSRGGVPDPRVRLFVNLAGGYGHTRPILMPHDSKRSAVLQRNRDRLGTLDHF
jgi:hypothetical protein